MVFKFLAFRCMVETVINFYRAASSLSAQGFESRKGGSLVLKLLFKRVLLTFLRGQAIWLCGAVYMFVILCPSVRLNLTYSRFATPAVLRKM